MLCCYPVHFQHKKLNSPWRCSRVPVGADPLRVARHVGIRPPQPPPKSRKKKNPRGSTIVEIHLTTAAARTNPANPKWRFGCGACALGATLLYADGRTPTRLGSHAHGARAARPPDGAGARSAQGTPHCARRNDNAQRTGPTTHLIATQHEDMAPQHIAATCEAQKHSVLPLESVDCAVC